MSPHNMSSQKAVVVIIGCGFAGQRAQRVLEKHQRIIDVVVIDPRGFWEYQPAASKAIVAPEHAVVLPQAEGTLRKAVRCVVRADEDDMAAGVTVLFEDSTEMTADFAIICTGSNAPSPLKARGDIEAGVEGRMKEIRAAAASIEKAQRICIVGGGPSAVEVCSEIADRYGSRKELTIVAESPSLCPRMLPEASRKIHSWLASRDVRVVTGERVVGEEAGASERGEERTIRTSAGSEIECDLVLRCTGVSPNVDVGKALACLRGRGGVARGIPVNRYLQVQGEARIFAAGDCTDLPFEKNIMLAHSSGKIAAKNVVTLVQAQAASSKPSASQRAIKVAAQAGPDTSSPSPSPHPPPGLLRFPEDATRGSWRLPVIAAVSLGSSQGVLQEEDRVHPRVGKAVSHRRRLMKQTLSVQRGSRLTLRVLSIAEGRLGRAINRSWEPKAAWTATSSRLKAVSAMAPASQGGSARGGAFVADCGEDRGESGAGGEKETTTRSRLSQETRQAPATARWVNEA